MGLPPLLPDSGKIPPYPCQEKEFFDWTFDFKLSLFGHLRPEQKVLSGLKPATSRQVFSTISSGIASMILQFYE
jgi:hypothetical protein